MLNLFQEIFIGEEFECAGNWYIKKSTRTAAMLHSRESRGGHMVLVPALSPAKPYYFHKNTRVNHSKLWFLSEFDKEKES